MTSAMYSGMKKQIILLASLLVLSIPTLAQQEFTETITCSGAAAKAVVKEMADDGDKNDFSDGLLKTAKALTVNFANYINFEAHSGKVSPLDVQGMVFKAACLKELSKNKTLSAELSANYKRLTGIVKDRAKLNLDNLPPQISGNQINTADVNNILYYNNDTVGFMLAMFGD